jgi:RimJ/RimL family protein N-acetyltransferase
MDTELSPPTTIDLGDAVLRPWTVADADRLRAALAASDGHLRAWTPWVVDGRVPGATLEERLAKHADDFATGVAWVYGMFSPDGSHGSEVVGGCGLYPRVGPRAVDGRYWVPAGHPPRVLAPPGAAALTNVAFADPRIDRVEIHCDYRNIASARIPERLGYRLMPRGADSNMLVWTLSREDTSAS